MARLNDVLEEIKDRQEGKVTTYTDEFGGIQLYDCQADYEGRTSLYEEIQKGRNNYLSLTEAEQEHLWNAVQYTETRLSELCTFESDFKRVAEVIKRHPERFADILESRNQ